MLDAGVVLEAVAGEVLAITAALISPVWHLGHQWNMGVDPDATEIEGFGHPHCAAMVLGPDR